MALWHGFQESVFKPAAPPLTLYGFSRQPACTFTRTAHKARKDQQDKDDQHPIGGPEAEHLFVELEGLGVDTRSARLMPTIKSTVKKKDSPCK